LDEAPLKWVLRAIPSFDFKNRTTVALCLKKEGYKRHLLGNGIGMGRALKGFQSGIWEGLGPGDF